MVHFTGSDIVLFVIGFFLPPLAGKCLCEDSCRINTVPSSVTEMAVQARVSSLGLTLLGHVPGIVYAWWIIYTNHEDPRTRRRINHHGQNNVDRRSYLAVAQQGHVASSSPPSSGVVHVAHNYDPQAHIQSQTQTLTTQSQEHPGLPHQDSQRSTRTVTTTTTTRSSNGGPAQTTYTTYTTQNGEVIVDKKDVVVDKKDAPPAY
ncbi:hypothetical protein BGW39_002960 [Mortierella sp. 14UC]|nr:hypothetical protein BGW39_002960 [Mortierella sp. 14UC]